MELEPSEEQNDNEAELKRCISRLSYVGMGLSGQLDRSLSELRDLAKSDADGNDLTIQIDEISKILRVMEDETSAKPIVRADNQTNLLELLLEQNLPAKLKKALKQELKKKPNKSEQNNAIEIASAIVAAIDNFINQLEPIKAPEAVAKQRFWGKLFGRKKELAAPVSEDVDGDTYLVSDELKTSLQQLVDQLSAMDNYNEVAVKLNKKIVVLHSVHELVGVLELITGAFVKVASHENQQFGNFLKSLSKRIDKVNSFIDQTVSYSQQVKSQSSQLDSELQDSVSLIKTSVEQSKSLTEVKQSLYQKLDAIVARVNAFHQVQEKNEGVISSNLEKLKEQLQATQDESSRLSDELAAQKARAQTDSLTQLPNRYLYNERLTQEYNRWRRYRNPLTMVIGDIDFFKKVNDKYGHAGGDEVLKKIAIFLQQELRESDFIARFGGEEFILLLPETNLIDATKAINKIRQGVKEVSIEFDNSIIQIAMSFGISEFEKNDTPKAVFRRADKALYRAKERGRDQVCCQRGG